MTSIQKYGVTYYHHKMVLATGRRTANHDWLLCARMEDLWSRGVTLYDATPRTNKDIMYWNELLPGDLIVSHFNVFDGAEIPRIQLVLGRCFGWTTVFNYKRLAVVELRDEDFSLSFKQYRVIRQTQEQRSSQ